VADGALGIEERKNSRVVLSTLFTVCAAAVVLAVLCKHLAFAWKYPNLSLMTPARALLAKADYERRVIQSGSADVEREKNKQIETIQRTWQALSEEERRWARERPLSELDRLNQRAREPALDLALAGWGDPQAIARASARPEREYPEYLRARAAELQGARPNRERERIASAGTRAAIANYAKLALFGAGLLGLLSRRRYRRSFMERQEKRLALGLSLGLFSFFGTVCALMVLLAVALRADGRLSELILHNPSTLGAMLAIAAVLLIRRARPGSAARKMFWLPRGKTAWRETLSGAFATLGLVSILTLPVGVVVGAAFPASWSDGLIEPLIYGSSWEAALMAFQTIVAAPIGEEILFRGMLFGALLPQATAANPTPDWRAGVHRAAVLSALIFALMHGYSIAGSIGTAIAGYLLARLYAQSGSLTPGILAHSLFNLVSVLPMLALRT